jgi:hypothetical protein
MQARKPARVRNSIRLLTHVIAEAPEEIQAKGEMGDSWGREGETAAENAHNASERQKDRARVQLNATETETRVLQVLRKSEMCIPSHHRLAILLLGHGEDVVSGAQRLGSSALS